MPQMRIAAAAEVLGVSDDTVRRLIDDGTLPADSDAAGRKTVSGADVAAYARQRASAAADHTGIGSSARNRFVGLVTQIRSDLVMSQVELQCGPFRVVSLMSTEAVHELGLEPGSLAVAAIKATNVVVDVAGDQR